MTDVPAGWYDDPEDALQYRYWDGSMWTDHRSPKTAPPAPTNEAGSLVSQGMNLLWQNWLPILLIGVMFLAIAIAVIVAIAAAASDALDPGLFTILERVVEPGFNPETNAADEAFVESIEFNPTAGFWVTAVVGVFVLVIAQAFSVGVAQIHLAAASVDRPLSLGESFAVAFRRLPRWIGIYLLWTVVFTVGVAVFVALIILASAVPILYLAIIPGAIAFTIYGYPYAWIAATSLILGRTEDPPFRTTVRLIRETGWRETAWPVFVINLVVIAVNIVASIVGAIPILGQLIVLVGQVLLYALAAALNIPLWRLVGGEIGEDIAGTQSVS